MSADHTHHAHHAPGNDGSRAAASPADGPVMQSVAISFKVLYLATLLLGVYWLTTNTRQVPPDSQAVVSRFGRVISVQQSGLVLAWPRPIDQVALLPAHDRQLSLTVTQTAPNPGLEDSYTRVTRGPVTDTSGDFLTGDGGVVLLSATLAYQVDDAAAYFLARDHAAPALRRIFLAAAVALTASHQLDDFLVARPDRVSSGQASGIEEIRQKMRGDFVREMNRRLAELNADGAGLGVIVSRVDLQAALPPAAKDAFDVVLEAGQLADQGIAQARTDAARTTQQADQEAERILTTARAGAAERVSTAANQTAAISALEAKMTPETRPGLLDQLYRDQLMGVMAKFGKVMAIDARGGSRLIIPGGKP